MTLIPRAGLSITPWRNKAGRKADIATGADWLIGFAFLDQDAPFSDYAGFDRTITLVEGGGFTLEGDGRRVEVPAVGRPTWFDGAWRLDCRLVAGPCVVLNIMSARAAWRHAAEIVGPALPAADPTAVAEILVVLEGSIGGAGRHDAIRRDGAALAASPDARAWRGRIWAA